jgi:dTDP-4-amino-4,6-dideoxygalactose transaminase
MPDHWREAPPTAGLPLRWRDFLPRRASLEDDLAAFLNVPATQVECSGTAALIVILTALKRASTRRSVVVPAYTCPLVVLAVIHCGLQPVLCDLDSDTFDLSQAALERLVDHDTLAIIPTHLGGRVADIANVIAIARRKGALVIEDAAQAMGATIDGQSAGTLADAGFYSLAVGKGLTLYEGGVLVARDEGLRQLLCETSQVIAPYRLSWEIGRLTELAGYWLLYRPALLKLSYGIPLRGKLRRHNFIDAVGDNFSTSIPLHRVGGWRRSIGATALTRLQAFLDRTAAQAAARIEVLRKHHITMITDPPNSRGTWPFLMVLMPSAQARDVALARLWMAGLGVGRLFIHALPEYEYLGPYLKSADVPNAREFASRMLTITNSPWLSGPNFEHICAVLKDSIKTTATTIAD